jgi:hypothetical protein
MAGTGDNSEEACNIWNIIASLTLKPLRSTVRIIYIIYIGFTDLDLLIFTESCFKFKG